MQREMVESDPDLVEACIRGEEEAWERLVRRYAGLVYGVARRYGLDDDDAADIFQNTWSALWERMAELRDRRRLSSWLITVAGRLSYQQYQRRQRQTNHQAGELDLESRPDTADRPDEIALARDEALEVRRAVERLPDRYRELIYWLFYDPAAPSYVEVAARLGVSPDSIGALRKRGLHQLRKILEGQRDG